AVASAGHDAVMTSPEHRSGTDRIAEVAASLNDAPIIVNVQGDEPLIATETIERAIEAIGEDKTTGGAGIVTTWERMDSAEDVLNPDVVKIVVDSNEEAVYFSRSPVPYPRDAVRSHGSLENALRKDESVLNGFRKHTGLYVYRRKVLLAMAKWPQTRLERLESLEQLRALEHGVKIKAIEASSSSIGVDTMKDLERVRAIVEEMELKVS
ncbi:MAG TPA: 3-deoxy-manno-octulosonate cytidylyltransferase, partial [Pyrinomonadaceae bacterium]|nr:3-deoxy-manno-octulosonate cytidylyltransferase [Pyrinomonadaceae bacterium]